jgi:predicted transcriptional regulator
MSASLTSDERNIIQRLKDTGLPPASASLAVVMSTREHSRPEAELVDIVRQYMWLESSNDAREAIRYLKEKGWLEDYTTYGTTLVRQSAKLRKKIADELNDQSVKDQLKQIRRQLSVIP